MNVIDLFGILFLLVQFFISGAIFHFFLMRSSEDKNITIITKILIYGIFTNISFLQLWHLFFPVNNYCALFLHIIQISFILDKKRFSYCVEILKIIPLHLGIIFFIFIAWISILTNSELKPSDSGLYHLPIINWNSSYRIIKGLANLSIDYGTNSNLFLLLSLVKSYPYYYSFLWSFNSVFLSIGFFSFFCVPLHYIVEKNSLHKEIIFRFLFFIPLIHYCFYFYPGTSTDLPIFIVGCIISIEFISIFNHKIKNNFEIIPLLIFLGITIKLSFLFYGIGILCIYLFLHYKKKNLSNLISSKSIYIFLFSFVLWISRGIILSGYPLLPITSISLPVSWKMNKEDAKIMGEDIINYGLPNQEHSNLSEKLNIKKNILFTQLTIQHRKIEILYPLIFGFFGLLYGFIYRKEKNLIILYPILIQMFLWIYIPKNRYSIFAAWWFCSNYLSLFLVSITPKSTIKYVPIIIVLLSFIIHKVDSLGQEKIFFPKYVDKEVPNTDLIPFKTNSGFEIFTPPPKENQCWNSELLCTPYPNKWLRPYNEFDLGEGFYSSKSQ
jgi:hypothetical protein